MLNIADITFFFCFRQLLSWYTLSQNPSVSAVDNSPALQPLWIRCDMSDPAGTTWMGAETVCVGNKVAGVKLYSVTCKGIALSLLECPSCEAVSLQ